MTQSTASPPTLDETELTARVASLSLEQKVRLLTGADFWSLHAEPAVGLRRLLVSDGPAGVRGERWDERDPSANVPSPTALAATWDEELVEELGGLLASEARRKGVDIVLAPTVNLHRTPYAGRHFECFSEDPLLTARIGVSYVCGLQDGGVGATVKHFVANDSETERMTLDARVDERTLRELYLAPFEAIVREAGAWSVMAAYNGVNGEPMTESALLRNILQGELEFDGLVMSDWFATRSTEASARAALDLVMPGPVGPWGDALVAAVRAGAVEPAAIDDKVRRILRLAARVGALEGTTAATAPEYDDAEIASMLRRSAAAGFVLARNDRGLLPLDPGALGRVAVIGPNAGAARTLGGGSATVFPPYTVSPLDGLRAALEPGIEIAHGVGVRTTGRVPVAGAPWLHVPGGGEPGVEVRFLDADGAVVATERRTGCTFTWLGSFGLDGPIAQIEVNTVLRATAPGTYTIGASGLGRYRMSVGGAIAFDERLELRSGADIVEGIMVPPQATHDVELGTGEEVTIRLAHEVGPLPDQPGSLGVNFQLNLAPPYRGDDPEIEHATAIAGAADAVILVVGTTEEVESEGFDRVSLSLPGRQDELVRRVADANPNTIVVVNAGAPVLMPWVQDVAAVLIAWFPGQEFGNALADVLLGFTEPGGRLPTTWPATEERLPPTQPTDGVLRYDEGLAVGYRDPHRDALFAFGHGLGFSSWEYESIDAPSHAQPGAAVRVTIGVRNTGQQRSREVIQLYASRRDTAIERPVRWLVGFASVRAEPGERASGSIIVPPRGFEHWSVEDGGWVLEPGTFDLSAGASSAALPLSARITVS
ncbi:MAG TPA: glycoside hydrolase family 3 C-terminal domain-containing protein [Solirubrobacteraceae bacterium]|nr:glycoside hydrolase family 3 C-terminal domain-containing protein [Solirubrobacteraceae bacterium]